MEMASRSVASGAAAELRPHVARDLLAGPAHQSHIVQFYENVGFLADVVAQFLVAGVAAGEPAVVVARPEHRAAFVERLRALGCDVDERVRSGGLLLLDADEMLARIVVDG